MSSSVHPLVHVTMGVCMCVPAFASGCGGGSMPELTSGYRPVVVGRSVVGYEAHYLLTWRDARIGDVTERVRRRGDRLRYQRHERLSLRRGDDLLSAGTRISIDIDGSLSSHRVDIEQVSGPQVTRGSATRSSVDEPWLASYGSEPVRELPADAIPAELVPLRLFSEQKRYNNGDVAFRGRVMLAGFGFALAHMEVIAQGEREFVVTVAQRSLARSTSGSFSGATDVGSGAVMRGRWHTTRYGSLARARGHNDVDAIRSHHAELDVPFEPPEIVDSTSVQVHGAPIGSRREAVLLVRAGDRRLPPDLPGQHIEVRADGWHVRLSAGDKYSSSSDEPRPDPGSGRLFELARDIVVRERARSEREQVVALTRATDRLLDDDLSAPATHARAALALGRGDCTSHALLFHALAKARGIPSRLVTGYRLHAGRLVRHRWAVAAIDGVWMAVDPTYGEAPSTARLLGLAMHGGSSAELAFIDETTFFGLGGLIVSHRDQE